MEYIINAAEHRKTVSTFQRKVNDYKRRIDKLVIQIEQKNHSLTLMNTFITKLLEDGRITKEEMVAAIKNRNHSKQYVKEHREKYGKAKN